MKKYLYVSELPCHVVINIRGSKKHMSLYKNEVYELPESKKVESLLAKGFIKEIKSTKPSKK